MSRVYTVLVPPGEAAGEAFPIAEGFSWGAVLTGPVWFLWNRAWLGLTIYTVGLLVLWRCYLSFDALAFAPLACGFFWLVGLSASDALRRERAARGWEIRDVVVASNAAEALIIWFARLDPAADGPVATPAAVAGSGRPLPSGGPASPLAPWTP